MRCRRLLVLTALVVVQPQAGWTALIPELERGIALVQEGAFEDGISSLEAVVRRFGGDPGHAREVARACLYLAVAHFKRNQMALAKLSVQDALRADPHVQITRHDFPGDIYAFFVAVKNEMMAAGPAPTPTPQPRPERPTKRGGSKVPLLVLGGAATAAGGVVALTAGGGTTTSGNTQPEGVTFVGSTPPPGGTISVSSGTLTQTYSVVSSRDIDAVFITFTLLDDTGRECAHGGNVEGLAFALQAGTARAVDVDLPNYGSIPVSCSLPFRTVRTSVTLLEIVGYRPADDLPDTRILFPTLHLNQTYSFVP